MLTVPWSRRSYYEYVSYQVLARTVELTLPFITYQAYGTQGSWVNDRYISSVVADGIYSNTIYPRVERALWSARSTYILYYLKGQQQSKRRCL